MKRYSSIVLLIIFSLCLSACTVQETPDSSTPTSSTPNSISVPTEADSVPSAVAWREPADIFIYPFTQSEIDNALRIIELKLDEFAAEPGVLSYDVEAIVFDPMTTDNEVLAAYYDSSDDRLTLEDYFSRRITFCVIYSATYDHSITFMEDVTHGQMEFTLVRESTSAAWTYWTSGTPRSHYPSNLLLPDELLAINTSEGDIVAAYHADDDDKHYWLFVRDPNTNIIQFLTQ